MSVQQRIAKLESLLDRVQRNAGARPPRVPYAFLRGGAAVGGTEVESAPAPVGVVPEVASRIASAPPPKPLTPTQHLAAEERPIAAASAEEEPVEVLESLEGVEIVEISEVSESVPPPPASELDFEEEEAPASAPRPAASIDEALDEAADAGYAAEPPIKTPPPESGRQPLTSPPIPPAPKEIEVSVAEEADLTGADDVDSLLEADHSGGPISAVQNGKPTMEQLGETVEFEGSVTTESGLEIEVIESVPPRSADELEAPLPATSFSGGYDESLAAPQSAARDLGLPQREEAEPPPAAPGQVPETTARPPVPAGAAPAAFSARAPTGSESFLGLLDASLALGRSSR